MPNLKFTAATCLLALAVVGCVRPQSVTVQQPAGIQRGDSLALLSPAKQGSIGAVWDMAVMGGLSRHIGGAVVAATPQWQVEYSFSARPVKIVMHSTTEKHTQPIGLPPPDYLIDCNRTSFRMTLRVVDAADGKAAYHATAEEQACASSEQEKTAVLNRLAENLIAGVVVR